MYTFEGQNDIEVPSIVEPKVLRHYFYMLKTNQKKLEDGIRYIETTERNDDSRRIALTMFLLKEVKLPKYYCPDVKPCQPKHLCCETSNDRPLVIGMQKDPKTGFFYVRVCHYGLCDSQIDSRQPYYRVNSSKIQEIKKIALPIDKLNNNVFIPAISIFQENPTLLLKFIDSILNADANADANAEVDNNIIKLWNAYDYDELKIALLINDRPHDVCYKIEPQICQTKNKKDAYVFPILIVILILYIVFSI